MDKTEVIVQYFRDNLSFFPPTRLRAAMIASELGVPVGDIFVVSRKIAVGLESLEQKVLDQPESLSDSTETENLGAPPSGPTKKPGAKVPATQKT